MDPESKKLLEETLELAQDNNSILRSMRRSQRMAHVMSFLYWVFIIGSAIGAYYLLEPYLGKLEEVYSGASNALDNLKQFNQ